MGGCGELGMGCIYIFIFCVGTTSELDSKSRSVSLSFFESVLNLITKCAITMIFERE